MTLIHLGLLHALISDGPKHLKSHQDPSCGFDEESACTAWLSKMISLYSVFLFAAHCSSIFSVSSSFVVGVDINRDELLIVIKGIKTAQVERKHVGLISDQNSK